MTSGRLCVCVSGQLRAPDASLARLKSALNGIDAALVFSVWDRIGRKLDGALNIHQMPRLLEPAVQEAVPSAWFGHRRFWAALPLLRRDLEAAAVQAQPGAIEAAIRTAFPEAVIDIEAGDLLDLDFPQPIGEDRHSLRMLYKVWRVNKIRRQVERRRGPFDAVVRIRPDLSLQAVDFSFVLEAVREGRFLVGAWDPSRPWCSDNFAAGTPQAMDAYAAAFARSIAEPLTWRHIHIDLAEHLKSLAIEPTPYPNCELLIEDERFGPQQVHDAIERMRGSGDWTDPHELTSLALAATMQLQAGDAAAAIDTLLRPDLAPSLRDPESSDGYWLVLGRSFLAAGEAELAALCALMSRTWDRYGGQYRCDVTVDCLAAALEQADAQQGGRDLPLDIATLLGRLDARPALRDLLTQALAPVSPAQWLAQTLRLTPGRALIVLRRMAEAGHGTLAQRLLPGTIEALAREPAAMEPGGPDAPAFIDMLHLARAEPRRPEEEEASLLERLTSLCPNDVHLRYLLADALKRARRFAEAAQHQARAVDMHPDHPGARRQLAELLIQLGRVEAARREAERALLLHDSIEHRVLVTYLALVAGDAPSWPPMPLSGAEGQAAVQRYAGLPRFAEIAALAGWDTSAAN